MSTTIAADVWKYSNARGAALLVLVSLADQANDAGECWPSVENIAARCRVSPRSVHRHIEALTELGELARTERPGRASVYLVQPPTSANLAEVIPEPTSANLTEAPDNLADASAKLADPTPANLSGGSATAGRQNHHLTGKDTSQEPSSSPTADAAFDREQRQPPAAAHPPVAAEPDEPQRDDVDRLCNHLADRIQANGSKRPTITREWRRQCRLLLDRDRRSETQVRTAIDWCQDDAFWMTNILSMPKLRDQYDTLRLRAMNQATDRARATRQQRNDQVFDAAMERARAADQTTAPQGELVS